MVEAYSRPNKMRIQQLREEKGLTQEALALKLWLTRQAVQYRETSDVALKESDLRAMAAALECSVGDLFDDPDALALGKLIRAERLEMVTNILLKANALSGSGPEGQGVAAQMMSEFHESLTIAEIIFIALQATQARELTDADMASTIGFLQVLKILNVPVTTVFKNLSPKQKAIYGASEEFLRALNQFKTDWARANAVPDR